MPRTQTDHMIEMTIDGHRLKVREGSSVLEAARGAGIKIPTLCHHKALSPYGACRLCLVEVSRGSGPGAIHASCTYPAAAGLVIKTDTDRIKKNRKIMIELMLARCPDAEQVRSVAAELGVHSSRFKSVNDNCILCGLCVRMCRERMGPAIIGFTGRGAGREVKPPFGAPSDACQLCGACAFICPTGKIKLGDVSPRKPVPIKSEYNMALAGRAAAYISYPQAVPNKAVIDASQCVHLLRGNCGICERVCEADAIQFDQREKTVSVKAGAVVLAPGFRPYDPSKKGEYGYRRFPNVLSSLDYERILSASGPFMGHVRRPSDSAEPKRIAFIQCVGSREQDNPWCSSVCCMFATKQAIITKEHLPGTECSIFVMDVRAFGKGFDEYYERAKEQYGIRYVHTRPSAIRQDFRTKNLKLECTSDGKTWQEEEFDLVILSSGLCPSDESKSLAAACRIELNQHDFAQSARFLPCASSREGVYLAGVFEEPKDIPESVTQASAAAAQAMELLPEARGTQVSAAAFPPERDVAGEEPRIGVFVCHCGSNIGGFIDCEKVSKYASGMRNVVYSTHLMYTCSPDGLKSIRSAIEEHKLNRVVVASCTPRTHEALFQKAIREKGLNAYLFEMANIRDQCTWVHARMGDLTERKAKDLVRMAVGRARTIEPLPTQTYVPKRTALVVGGGVAGMTAALSISRQGYRVHLVEKAGKLGGNVDRVKSTIEGLSPESLLARLLDELKSDERITVHMNSQVEETTGFTGNFRTKVRKDGGGPAETIEIEHGASIIATGAAEMKPDEYLYDKDSRVMTQQELEEMMEKDPPFTEKLKEVVMIQCVGSRQPDRKVCCRVGCTEAVKNAILLKRRNPDVRVAILYRDIRTYGFKEDFYNEARRMGVLFFRYDLDAKPEVTVGESGALEVRLRDLNSSLELSFSPDILALSASMVPSPDNHKVGMIFKVPVNLDGFFLEAHMKLRPVDFASDGIFLCGTCHSPKFIEEAIIQAKAAAARAVAILSREVMEVSGVVSRVDPDKCAACLTCVRTCPYSVPRINEKNVAEIEAAMCHGCGVCASECPAKAIELMHYKDSQVTAKTKAMLDEQSQMAGIPG